MIAQLASTVLPALFIGSGVLGLGVLGTSWLTYGGAFRRLRRELAACDDLQPATITLARHEVRVLGASARPALVRPMPVVRRAVLRPAPRQGFSPARLPAQPAAA